MTESATGTGMRASDVERRDVVEMLQRHYTAGRLTLTELDQRISAGYAARTRDQLAALVADLPADPPDAVTTEPVPMVGTVDPGLLCVLWWLCPPAALAYNVYTRRARRRLLDGASR